MLGSIISAITGSALKQITEPLAKAWSDYHNAQTAAKRLQAQERIAQLQDRKEVLLREQGSWRTCWIRPAFALPFIIYDAKILVWDKVLGFGVTDNLSPEFWQLQMIVFGAYFLSRPFEK